VNDALLHLSQARISLARALEAARAADALDAARTVYDAGELVTYATEKLLAVMERRHARLRLVPAETSHECAVDDRFDHADLGGEA
jgi:hypothetical protein